MAKVDIAGVLVDNVTKAGFLVFVEKILKSDKTAYVVTPYSEFVVAAQHDKTFMTALNHADMVLADGIGIVWAGYYLYSGKYHDKKGLTAKLWSLLGIWFDKKNLYEILPEKVSGSDVFLDVVEIVVKRKKRIFLLGGKEGVSFLTKRVLEQKFPKISIVGRFTGKVTKNNNSEIVNLINESKAEVVLLGLSYPLQEIWMYENRDKFPNVRLMMGLGGTFDFLTGKRKRAPKAMRWLGLEWLWRLLIEPMRIKRIYKATVEFVRCIRKK
jgi:N-acetylglucosaminyldiphosphoundecaprenol N-acetyl-beta-D-mannosaminyltransferase